MTPQDPAAREALLASAVNGMIGFVDAALTGLRLRTNGEVADSIGLIQMRWSAYVDRANAALRTPPSPAAQECGEPTDAMIDAVMRAADFVVEPHEAETECGVPVECGISDEDAATFTAENREMVRGWLRAALAADRIPADAQESGDVVLPELPAYSYGKECAPTEKVWHEDAMRAYATAAVMQDRARADRSEG